MKPIKKLTISGLFIAMYVVIIALTASVSFGQIQVRLANCLYALPFLFPFLALPTGIAVILSNIIFGGLGIYDALGGFMVGCIVGACVAYLGQRGAKLWTIIIPIILIPALIVPVWLSMLLHVPYLALVASVGAGQVIPALVGVAMVKILSKLKLK